MQTKLFTALFAVFLLFSVGAEASSVVKNSAPQVQPAKGKSVNDGQADAALTKPATFKPTAIMMPSGNVYCLTEREGIRCDIMETSNPQPAPPPDCPVDYGKAFWLPMTGMAERLCHGDTVADPNATVFEYGQTMEFDGIVCTSAATGLECSNQSGNGFKLRRAEQLLY